MPKAAKSGLPGEFGQSGHSRERRGKVQVGTETSQGINNNMVIGMCYVRNTYVGTLVTRQTVSILR